MSVDIAKLVATAGMALLVGALLAACEAKPWTTAAVAPNEGPTAASGGPPSKDFPAGINPAPSGATIHPTSPHVGPSEGGTAVGGVSAGQSGGAPAAGGTSAPTSGDGKSAP